MSTKNDPPHPQDDPLCPDPREMTALGVTREAFAMGATRGLARDLMATGTARDFAMTAADAAMRLMLVANNPDDLASPYVTVRREWLTVMLAAYQVAAEVHAASQPLPPPGPVS